MNQLPLTEKASGCGCGHHDEALPVLDARSIPHAIRHGAIFGALGQLQLGSAMVLVAPHDPLPLLAQIAQRNPGQFETAYLVEGPDDWHLRFTRVA